MAPRACVRVYARVLVPPNLYIHTYTHITLIIYYNYIYIYRDLLMSDAYIMLKYILLNNTSYYHK